MIVEVAWVKDKEARGECQLPRRHGSQHQIIIHSLITWLTISPAAVLFDENLTQRCHNLTGYFWLVECVEV